MMTAINFVGTDGKHYAVEVNAGASLMEAAIRNGVPGIDADCGGACSCATCHIYVDGSWIPLVGEGGEMELAMLEFAHDVKPNSRLACQIRITEDMDGMTVRLPETQY